jgi:hypothetical protein
LFNSWKSRAAGFAIAAIVAVPVFGLASSASAAQGGTNVPIQGSGSAVETIFYDGSCPGNQGSSVVGTEHLSHLGLSTFSTVGCLLGSSSPTTTTAANGDQLIDSVGSTVSTGNTFTGTLAFTGGTGRFLGASGSATISGTIVPLSANTLALTFSLTGTISY